MTVKWIAAHTNNYGSRYSNKIDKIVVHWMAGTLASCDATFQSPARIASAHYGIGGDQIHQYVKEEDAAWHCGNLLANRQSIGIEHEGGPNLPISELTYQTSAKLIKEICDRYSIPLDRTHIKGHNEFSATQCPGTLDTDKLISLAKQDTMTPDEQRTLQVITEYQKRTSHTNLEGAVRHAIGAADMLPSRELELNQVRSEVEDLKKAVAILKSQVDEMAVKLVEKEKSEADWQRNLTLANRKVSNLEEDLEAMTKERTDYKRRYEAALDQKADKLTSWELLKLFIQKITWKKQDKSMNRHPTGSRQVGGLAFRLV